MWVAGDHPAVMQRSRCEVDERLVRQVGVCQAEDMLDVACGIGNVAIRAAQAGGQVVGVGLTSELFDAGRRLANGTGVEVDWVEGDAEELPFPSESFERCCRRWVSSPRPAPPSRRRSWCRSCGRAGGSGCARGRPKACGATSSARSAPTPHRRPNSPSRRCRGGRRSTPEGCSRAPACMWSSSGKTGLGELFASDHDAVDFRPSNFGAADVAARPLGVQRRVDRISRRP